MTTTRQTRGDYRDLLWDFSTARYRLREKQADYDQAQSQGSVELRVFAGEEEIYDADPAQAQIFHIPMDLFSPLRKPAPSGRDSLQSEARSVIAQQESMPDAPLLYDMGRQLWEAIPPAARQPLLDTTGRTSRPCRLKISSDSPAIDDLPWEWLNDGLGEPFALRPEIRLVRSVPIPVAAPPISFESPLRVLLVLTNPKDERLLNPWREIEAIRPALSTGYYDLKILEEPTWDAFVQAVSPSESGRGGVSDPPGREPHIVHYIGHAGVVRGEGNLILHDSQNVTHWISGPEIAQVLPLTVRLLCLSTCFTAPNYQILGLPRLAHTSAIYRLPTTVANRYPVDEGGVHVFWQAFYTALARHRGNVNEAFSKAQRATAVDAPGADWGSFSLVIRDQSGKMMRPAVKAEQERRLPGRESPFAGGAEPTSPPGDEPTENQKDAQESDPRAIEIQAQLSSLLANQLAAQMRNLGPNAPESMRKQYREEAARASDLLDQLQAKPKR